MSSTTNYGSFPSSLPPTPSSYIPSLPERTQYFDTGVLFGAVLNPDAYSVGFLSLWREVSLNVLRPQSLIDHCIRFDSPKSLFSAFGIIHPSPSTGLPVYLRCLYTSKQVLGDTDEEKVYAQMEAQGIWHISHTPRHHHHQPQYQEAADRYWLQCCY